MTLETETNMNEAINWLQQTGGAFQNFAFEQAPLYCREVIAWEFWSGVIFGSIGAVLIVIAVFAIIKFVHWMNEDQESTLRTGYALIMTLICGFFGIMMVAHNVQQAVKAAVAPRLTIVKHLAELRK